MAAATSSSTLHFPSEQQIIDYLKIHPSTNNTTNPYLTEKKIINAVAKIFANTEKTMEEIQSGCILALRTLNLGLSQFELIGIIMNLKTALIDCANNKDLFK